MNEPRFGTAGLADSYTVKKFDPAAIAAYTAGFGLTAFEYQCGRGVRLAHDKAHALGEACAARCIALQTGSRPDGPMAGIGPCITARKVDYNAKSRRRTMFTPAHSTRDTCSFCARPLYKGRKPYDFNS